MSGHLAVGHRVWGLLELENLEIVALDFVRHDEVGVEWALSLSSLLAAVVAFPRKTVAFETRSDGNVGDHHTTGPTLKTHKNIQCDTYVYSLTKILTSPACSMN